MHKLMEYICDELEELERKVDKEGKLSATEIQYADMLAHTKKNLLKADEMMDEGEYSGSYRRSYRMEDGSYARGRRNARRDAMGRYSRRSDGYSMDNDDMIDELHELMRNAPDERTRMEFQKFIQKIEK